MRRQTYYHMVCVHKRFRRPLSLTDKSSRLASQNLGNSVLGQDVPDVRSSTQQQSVQCPSVNQNSKQVLGIFVIKANMTEKQ